MLTEDSNAAVHLLLGSREWDSMEQVNARLRELMQSGAIDREMRNPSDAKAKARKIAGDALRTDMLDERERLAAEALALDPDCVDAQLALIPFAEEESVPRYREVIGVAWKQIDAKTAEKDRGHFWGVHQTRPLIRAMQHLAVTHLWLSQYDEMAAVCNEILELNSADNLGVRELLLVAYLRQKEKDKGKALIERFSERESAAWNWAIFLHETLFGTNDTRLGALRDALRVNVWVPERLLGITKVNTPHNTAATGSKDEADNACILLQRAIEPDPVAYLEWLARHINESVQGKPQ